MNVIRHWQALRFSSEIQKENVSDILNVVNIYIIGKENMYHYYSRPKKNHLAAVAELI